MRSTSFISVSGGSGQAVASLMPMSAPLTRRIGSALVIGPPALACAYWGGGAFAAMLVVVMVILAWEWSRLCRAPLPAAGGLALGACLVGSIVAASLGQFLIGALLLLVGGSLALVTTKGNGWLAVGAFYLGLPALALIWLRQDAEWGRLTLLWLFAVVWASDIGAYAAGRVLGGPRLAPRISPNKTWSGLGGAIVSAAVVSAVVAAASGSGASVRMALLGALLGLMAQAGDLAESWMKRRFGVKDVSRLIPGHGGMLDRVDGLLVAALVTALIAVLGNGKMWT